MTNVERDCLNCGKRFTPKRPWAVFDSSHCKEMHRRANEEMGARFRASEPEFRQIRDRLGAVVAKIAAERPLFSAAVAEIAAVHAKMDTLIQEVDGSPDPKDGHTERPQQVPKADSMGSL